ncbi:hypothetical protein ABZX77_14895 [Streptomyces sp. NPDC004237]|uniref:hypothetical protein n=1 Tax=Streptomyces sp. NPDC004237 TaxID=3154455 RepID=UPI0033B53074
MNALGHAINVANTLGRYLPDAPPQVVAACLLHAIPQWPMTGEPAHEFVEAQCGVEARLLLEALRAEHHAMALPSQRAVDGHLRLLRTMPWLAHSALSFKIVSLQYATAYSAQGRPDAAAAWKGRVAGGSQLPYLRQLRALAAELVPAVMADDFARLLDQCLPMTAATSR